MAFQRKEFEVHPDGEAMVTFVDHKPEQGNYGPQIRLDFDSEEEMGDGRPFRVCWWITEAFNPKSKSYKFLKAMGVDVESISDEDLAEISLDDLIGQKCRLVIEHEKQKDGSLKHKVVNVLPPKKTRPAERPASRPEPEAAPQPAREKREPVAAGTSRKKTAEPDWDDEA